MCYPPIVARLLRFGSPTLLQQLRLHRVAGAAIVVCTVSTCLPSEVPQGLKRDTVRSCFVVVYSLTLPLYKRENNGRRRTCAPSRRRRLHIIASPTALASSRPLRIWKIASAVRPCKQNASKVRSWCRLRGLGPRAMVCYISGRWRTCCIDRCTSSVTTKLGPHEQAASYKKVYHEFVVRNNGSTFIRGTLSG